VLGFLLLFVGFPSKAFSQSASGEYKIKAVFLFNFAQFVEWPESAFPHAKAPVVIGILGTDPFGRFLDETVRNERVNGRSLQVARFRSVEEITRCHILFVSASEISRLASILDAVKGKPILTVGDTEGFASQGGMVRFIMDQNRIRFRINVAVVAAGGLTISSKLLRVAEIVGAEKEK
jgi:hypothetical protein